MKTDKYIKIILILIILAFNTNISYNKTGKWVIVDELPVNKSVYSYLSLKCADSLNCISFIHYSLYSGYRLRRTTDGGIIWKEIYSDTSKYDANISKVPGIVAISHPTPNLIIGVGDYGLVVRSTDKGETWEKQKLNDSIELYRIFMADEYYGYVQGQYYHYLTNAWIDIDFETYDGGKTWNNIIIPIGLSEINFINSETLYGLASWKDSISVKVKLIKVSNRWKNYDTLNRPGIPNWLFAVDENNLWLTGGDQVLDSAGWQRWTQNIYHSGDGGKTWETQRDMVFGGDAIHESHFYDKNFGMACGYRGLMLITFDGGKHWLEEFVEDSIPNGLFFYMSDVQVVSPTTAFVIGSGDYVYKYTRNPVGVEEEHHNLKDLSISPNPATEYIEITYSPLEKGARGLLEDVKIYNVFGEEIPPRLTASVTPQEGNLGSSSSQYSLLTTQYYKLDVSSLPPGVYFVRVGEKVAKFVKM